MKKVIEDYVKSNFKCDTGYSGSIRTMYIKGERNQEALRAVRERWPNLAFYIVTTKEIPEVAKENPLTTTTSHGIGTITSPVTQTIKQPSLGVQLIEEVIAEEKQLGVKEQKEKLRSDVDAYLLNTPIDKSKPGFYVPIAKKFGCTSDYIRKRYNSLKERSLLN